MSADLPSRARVVIIGGGIIGTSVAYHLTALGWTDLVLIEQGHLSGGTTWHAAGLVGQLRATESGTRLVQYSAQLYEGLEAETGLATGFKRCGGVTVARTADRMVQLQRTAATAEAYDLECELISPDRARELYPILETQDLVGAIWLPGDGTANPTDVTQSLARGARDRGARIVEGTRVIGVAHRNGVVTGVSTDRGDIEAEVVVNCAGQWAMAVGALAGVNVPLHSAEHFYVVTEQIDGVHRQLPILRDPDGYTYFKEEVGGLVVGGFEPQAKPWVAPDRIPYPFEFQLLDEDWEHFSILMENALLRIPALHHTGIKKFYNGPESFTPDNQFILGEAPELTNFFVAAGFNSVGIASAGGAGTRAGRMDRERRTDQRSGRGRHPPVRALQRQHPVAARPGRRDPRAALRDPVAESRTDQRPSISPVAGVSPAGRRRGVVRLEDGLGTGQRVRPARAIARAALHLGQAELAGLVDCRAAGDAHGRGRLRPDLVRQVADNRTGRTRLLQWLCTADVDVPIGRAVYTGMLNERGGYEADVTVTRLAHDQYLLVTGSTSSVRDRVWISRHIRPEQHVDVVDVTSAYAIYGVMGPKSRALLQRLSRADFSNEAFPFGTSREIDLGYCTARAIRITYVGELGWELHVPAEFAVGVYESLIGAGAEFGLVNAGYYTINSLRLEKGYRAFGSDLTPDYNPVEAGLLFTCKLKTDIAFLGRDAVEKVRLDGPRRKLVSLVVDDPDAMVWGGELVLRDGLAVGQVMSAAWGATVGGGIALAYIWCRDGSAVTTSYLKDGQYEINVGGVRHRATVHLRPPVDPDGLTIKV